MTEEKVPVDIINSYLEEAKKTALLPKEETDTIEITLEMEVLGFIKGLAAAWHCSENDVLVATLMAMVKEDLIEK